MTRRELVEALTANVGEDEEVYIRYFDDGEEYFDQIAGVETKTENFRHGHYEVIENGTWRRLSQEENLMKFLPWECRYVQDGTYAVERKCIVI